jgi:hypothetical protein
MASNHSIDSIQLTQPKPAAYRLRRDSYGGLVLQGLFHNTVVGNLYMSVWKDIPIVESDETSEPIDDERAIAW